MFRVIASEAKQSTSKHILGCFVASLLAKTSQFLGPLLLRLDRRHSHNANVGLEFGFKDCGRLPVLLGV